MRRVDIASALLLLGASLFVALATWRLPYWSNFAPGPAFASLWEAAAGAVIGAVLLVRSLGGGHAEEAEWPDSAGRRRVLSGIALLAAFPALLPVLGAPVTGVAFILVFLLAVAGRPLIPSLVTSVGTVGLIELVFDYWLRIDMPRGLLGL
jgi:hypothetical protein